MPCVTSPFAVVGAYRIDCMAFCFLGVRTVVCIAMAVFFYVPRNQPNVIYIGVITSSASIFEQEILISIVWITNPGKTQFLTVKSNPAFVTQLNGTGTTGNGRQPSQHLPMPRIKIQCGLIVDQWIIRRPKSAVHQG